MKKYNTRPIDFTGCHPVIAEHLKRGKAIKCIVWDNLRKEKGSGFVVGYYPGQQYPYRCDNNGVSVWSHAEPILRKVRRIMPPERAIPTLIAEGWRFDDSSDMIGPGKSVVTNMFKLMGKPLSAQKVSEWKWPDCIIEEVEDDE